MKILEMMKMKKLLMTLVLLPLMALADTETVDGITWTYTISGGTAEVKSGYYSSAIPTTTIGAINIPLVLGGKPVTSIGNYAFYSCSGITAVTIPSSVTSIGESAFCYCSGLTAVTIPSGVTRIGSYAFEYCSGLKSMTIPKSMTDLGYSVFYGCTGIESISLPFVGSRRGNGGNFSSLFGSGSGSVPATLTKVAITDDSTLPPYAFQNCKYIESITLPIGMSSIGYGAFQGCESLRSVPLPLGVSGIGSYAFQRCLSLTEMTIPVGVQQLESSVFDECLSLASVILPVGLTSIGYGAFRNCRNLYRINIPNTVTSISSGAFAGCTGLGSGVVVVDKCLLSVNGNCPANVVIDKDVRLIVAGAFSECENLQSVTINAQIEELPDDFFEYCSNLKKVVLPSSLRVIGGWAFCWCHSLEDIQLPEGLVEIQEGAFNGCASIRSFNIPASVTELWSLPTGWYDDWDEEVFIPSKLAKLTVASGNKVYAAYDNVLYSKDGQILLYCLPSVSSVAIRKGTKYITYGAFQSCSKLTGLTIPEGIVAIGDLWDWVDEDWPSFDFMDGGPFDGCAALWSLSLPSTVESIYMGNPPSLTKLTVAAGNKYYFASDNVLYDKENSQLIYCPPALKKVKIWDETESISSYAFEHCKELESLTIPASVKKIGRSPFWGCEKLRAIYYKGNAPVPLNYNQSACWPTGRSVSWEEVDEEEAAKIQEWWELYLFDSWGGGCSPKSEFLNVTSYVQKGTKWWGDSGEWQGRPLVFVDSIENPVVKYVVSFDPCGGEATVDHVEIESGKAVGPLPTPTRSKYKFLGWYTAAEGGTKISSTTKVTSDVTYYAQWMYDGSATVVVNVGSGCAGMGTVSGGKMAKAGTKVTLKATAKPGYVFAGWYCDAAGEEPVEGGVDYRSPSYNYVVGEDDVTFYAKFIPVDEDWVGVWCRPQDEYVRGGEIAPLAVAVGSASLATVKVTGLPTGLKFTAKPLTLKATNNHEAEDLPANTIYGTPTKSGIYTATITATTAGKKSETYKVDFVVRGDGEYLVDVMGIDGADYPTNGSDMQHAIQWGKMSGYGVFKPNKTATLKATANKGYVFAGWFSEVACVCEGGEEDDGCIYTPAAGSVDYRSTSFPVKVGYEDVLYYARFVRAEEDDKLWANVEDAYYLNGPWSLKLDVESMSLPTVTVKGLPTGLKFDTKTLTISGTPTKPGTYPVTLTLKNKTITKAKTQTFTLYVANIESPCLHGVDYANDAYAYRVGTSMEFDIGSCARDGYSVTGVSGLPSGLKFDKNSGLITGVPTKAGPKTVTITLKNGKLTSSATITLNVDEIDTWAYGTFNGGGEEGVLTLTVGNTGKISGKWMTVDGSWTLSAKSYESYDEMNGSYLALLDAKCGKENAMFVLAVYVDGQMELRGEHQLVATAKRNVWKEAPWKDLATQMRGASFTLTDEVSLKVGTSGVVTASGKFVTGQNAQGKDIVYSASCSTVLVPVTENDFGVYLCFPKKNGKFGGAVWQGVLEWSGSELLISKTERNRK